MRLIVVRHGETHWNVDGRKMGQLNSPLTARGVQQAKLVAERLSSIANFSLFSSDLGRTLQTANIVSSRCSTPILIDADFRERHLGVFQGRTSDQIKSEFPNEWTEYCRIGFDYFIPQSESRERFSERIKRALQKVRLQTMGDAVAISHSGFLVGMLKYVLSPGAEVRALPSRNHAGLTTFSYADGFWRLDKWNDIDHLSADILDGV